MQSAEWEARGHGECLYSSNELRDELASLSHNMSWLKKRESWKFKEETKSADSAVSTVREDIALEIIVI